MNGAAFCLCLGSQPVLQGISWEIYLILPALSEMGLGHGQAAGWIQHPVNLQQLPTADTSVQGQFWRGDTPGLEFFWPLAGLY